MRRIHLLVDDPHGSQRRALLERARYVCGQLNEHTMPVVMDAIATEALSAAFESVGATEGSLWIVDARTSELVATYNSGASASRFLGTRQPLASGVISMVFATERAFVENHPERSKAFSAHVDESFQQRTLALMAVPFRLFSDCVGTLSCVKLATSDAVYAPFEPSDLRKLQRANAVLERLVEHQILQRATGLADE